MPFLDVSEVLSDPDFCTIGMTCTRTSQTVSEAGLGMNVPASIPFNGVVTSDKGAVLARLAAGERIEGSIIIHSRFRLRAGSQGYTADVVTWNGAQYTVTHVNDYSTFGRGFVAATCDLLPLGGYADAPV